MSLGKKIALLLMVLGVCFSVGGYFALRVTIFPTFESLEHDAVIEDQSRVDQLLSRDLRALEVFNMEYSVWDQTYAYAKGERPSYPDENLDPSYWHSVDTHMMLVFDVDGELLGGLLSDPETGERLDLQHEMLEPLVAGHPLVTRASPDDHLKGLLRVRSGLLHVVSYPVLKTSGDGPIAGSLVTGQFLSKSRVRELGNRAATSVSLHLLGESADNPLPLPDHALDTEYTPDVIYSRQVLADVFGKPVAVLEIGTPRDVSNIGRATIAAAMVFLVLASIIFILAAMTFMQRQIVAPVSELTRSILHIQKTGDLEVPFEVDSDDELGVLGAEFKTLTEKLAATKADLEEARDDAVALAAAKSEFLARMSHEIRTPMNGILGMTELLRNTALEANQQHFTETIYSSAETLLQIINDILDFSKIEAGRLKIERIECSLRSLVEETVMSLADQAQQKGLELNVVIPPDLDDRVRCDPLRLRQVLTNLVGNAIKFTERGEIIVRLASERRDDERLDVRIEVEDTGIGIPEDKQATIFDSFTQADGTTTRVYGGTGLGLTICAQLVELMGGELGVESTPGVGSTFHVSLHLERLPRGESGQERELASVAGKRVLIVDDNATNREILETQLGSWRAVTQSAADAASAMSALQDAQARSRLPDLVFVDMNMPNVHGLQLAEWIREHPEFDDVRLVILSSLADAATEEEISALRICGQMTKPVRQSQLYDTLIAVFSSPSTDVIPCIASSGVMRSLRGKVLLAEDNPVNQAVAIGLLERLGVAVDVANNGVEALDLVDGNDYDAVLMDCQMPVLDGFTATTQLREAEEQKGKERLPVIAVTANALEGDRERCIAAGMDDYLSKPFTGEQLHAVLSLYIGSGSSTLSADSGVFETGVDAANDPSPLDAGTLQTLASLGGGSQGNLLEQVITLYFDNSPDLLAKIREAVAAGDAGTLRESAHALKSSSGNVGATRLADYCKQLEVAGREENLESADGLLQQLEAEYERVRQALKHEYEAAVA